MAASPLGSLNRQFCSHFLLSLENLFYLNSRYTVVGKVFNFAANVRQFVFRVQVFLFVIYLLFCFSFSAHHLFD